MASRARKPSPVLQAAKTLIEDADDVFVSGKSRFKHSFEADVDAIAPDPGQPRRSFDEESLRALASTMEAEGQLQPVLLRRAPAVSRRWILVAGERRWRAASSLGWKTILAIEFNGDPEVASLLENLQRVDLEPLDEAFALQRLIDGKGWTQQQAADALGKAKSEISGVLRILTLPNEQLQVLTSEPSLSRNVLIELARVPMGPLRDRLLQRARDGRLTIKAIRLGRADDRAASSTQLSERGFNFSVLERVTSRLSDFRLSVQTLTDTDRARLQRLRGEIDALLAPR